jgi:predicted RNase H-like nuclease (RuvC/YqgF family)
LVHKADSQSKQEVKQLVEKHESVLAARRRDFEERVEEMEEKMLRARDEAESSRRTNERLQRQVDDLRREVDLLVAREERSASSFQSLVDRLRVELKEREREC